MQQEPPSLSLRGECRRSEAFAERTASYTERTTVMKPPGTKSEIARWGVTFGDLVSATLFVGIFAWRVGTQRFVVVILVDLVVSLNNVYV